ncbi:MAG TPA: globin domain-containing protein [Methylophilaceae bacterium]|nr:globin domain-containing protein [Methylophilaceae bacterium]
MLSNEAKSYIHASVPVLREHGNAITKVFYQNLFTSHPELKHVFNMGNQANGAQQQSLAAAVFAYASNIDQLENLTPVVRRIAHKHASLGIKPEQYPIVGQHLLGAIKQTLGEAATTPLLQAWEQAYGMLADTLISFEKTITDDSGKPLGQMLRVRVSGITIQSEFVKSFQLTPVDAALPHFHPGQYISVLARFADGSRQLRQYSLSDATDKPYLRISVKRETGSATPDGQVSNWLHDQVTLGDEIEISLPYGDFTPDIMSDQPIILVSAGIGITPMISTLNEIAARNPSKRVIFAHLARRRAQHAHIDDLLNAFETMTQLDAVTFYKSPGPNDNLGANTHAGNFDVSKLPTFDIGKTSIFICGPSQFMREIIRVFSALGVPRINIHREVFGPDLLDLYL